MDRSNTPIFVYTTWPDISSAKRVGGELVAASLAACVNITPGMISIYHWEGKQETGEEVVMIIKSRVGQVEAVIQHVEAQHPHETPAVMAWPATGGSTGYLEWITQMTSVKPK